MIYFYNIIKTFIFYVVGGIVSVFFIVMLLPFSLLPASSRYDNRVFFFLSYLWNRILVFLSFVRYSVEGKENIPNFQGQPVIILSNHASSLDIPLIEICLKCFPHIWMSKAIFAKIPVFGFILRRMSVLVDRKNIERSMKSLRESYNLTKGK